jgi:ubiquinone biosynthesis protein
VTRGEPPEDLEVGAFSFDAPWRVLPDDMPWRRGIARLRADTHARVPELIRRRRVPPPRMATVAWKLGRVIAPWSIRERKDRGDADAVGRLAAPLRGAFESLGTTYIKFGQLIASAEGMAPAALVDEFKRCRDQVPPESFSDVRGVVEADFARSLAEVFAFFDPIPIAAASIAQVHAARLLDGADVVVKVQRPGIDEVVSRDLAVMSWAAPMIEKRAPQAALANMPAYVELFAETILEELDFRLEAQNMLDIAAVLATTRQRSVIVPRPHPELVTRRVLVMERLRGFKIDDDAEMVAAGVDPSPVFSSLMIGFFEGALIHGVFHGDLHGGNMIVTPDGRPGIFDFGITGRLTAKARGALLKLLMSGPGGDPRAQLEGFRDLGGFPPDADLEKIATDLRIDELQSMAPAEMEPEEIAAQMRELVVSLVAYGARLPKDLFLFLKGMVYLNGAIAALAADIDILAEMSSVFEHFVEQHGEGIASEHGVDLGSMDFSIDTMREQIRMQTGADVEQLTYRELQQLQEEQRERMRLPRA